MTNPKPDKFGIYPAPSWQLSNPDYEREPPVVSRDGRTVSLDAGSFYDAAQLGRTSEKGKKG